MNQVTTKVTRNSTTGEWAVSLYINGKLQKDDGEDRYYYTNDRADAHNTANTMYKTAIAQGKHLNPGQVYIIGQYPVILLAIGRDNLPEFTKQDYDSTLKVVTCKILAYFRSILGPLDGGCGFINPEDIKPATQEDIIKLAYQPTQHDINTLTVEQLMQNSAKHDTGTCEDCEQEVLTTELINRPDGACICRNCFNNGHH